MRIAIIDDGISEKSICLSQNIEHYKVLSDLRIIKLQKAPMQNISHGTICEAIFEDIYPDNPNPIMDISVLDKD
jgi:hypothetical protein